MNIVLLNPEIPYNTGNIGRTSVLTNTKLHLIKPLGFSLDEKQLAALNTEIDNIVTLPELNNLSIIYQIKAVSALVKGKTDESYQAINTGIDLEMSWLNYVLLGKVYEMKGMNREAADAYLTAFNLRPGANTLYWIENGIFQTSVPYVVPYLDKFLASE